jgi:hypothetical protein
MFRRLEGFRRIAARYDRRAANFLADFPTLRGSVKTITPVRLRIRSCHCRTVRGLPFKRIATSLFVCSSGETTVKAEELGGPG